MKNSRPLLPSSFIRFTLVFAVLCSVGLSALSAPAEPILGKLRNNNPKQPLELILVNSSRIVTIDGRPEVLSYLRFLSTGDSISASGRISNDGKKAYLESLDRVGLQELLGAWRSSSREIFEFQTYDKLNVYIPTVTLDGAISLSQTRSLQYVLTPEKENRFSIFMTDQMGNVRLAFLRLEKHKLELTLTDSNTGQMKEKLSLSPFYLR